MYTIEQANLEDRDTIREIASRTWEPTYRNILSKTQIDYMFEMMYSLENLRKQMVEQHHQFFIIRADGRPVAYLSIEPKSGNRFNFQKIYSLPEMHGKGVGRFIIEQGVAYLKAHYPTPFVVELYVNRYNPAVGFYQHMGLKIADTRDHDIGNGFFMNDYIMEMEVNA